MADLVWAVFCEKHLVEPDSNIISLMSISETLQVEGLAAKLAEAEGLGKKGALVTTRTQLASWWFRSDPQEAELQARVVLQSPDGKRLFEQPIRASWEDKTFLRVFLNFPKLPIAAVGFHWFIVENLKTSGKKPRWAVVTRIPFEVSDAST